jgi:hypothetical protein
MSKKKLITMVVEKTNTGYSAYAKEAAIFTVASDLNELYENTEEALSLAFDREVRRDEFQLHIDLPQFFKYYRVLNAKFLAERIGMNPTLLSQYVSGTKSPGPKQVHRILTGIHEIGKELSDLKFLV